MIHAAVAFKINQTIRCDVIHKPTDLIRMRLDHHAKGMIGIDHTHSCAVRIYVVAINIRL